MSGVMTENEGDEDLGREETEGQEEKPTLTPVRPAPIKTAEEQADSAEEFEIEEVDESGQPYGSEDRLTEASQGGTILEQRQQQAGDGQTKQPLSERAARRARQRQAKERSQNQIAVYERELAKVRKELAAVRGNVDQRLTKVEQEKLRDQARVFEQEISRTGQELKTASRALYQAMRSGDDDDECDRLGQQRDELALKRLQLLAGKQQLDAYIVQQEREGTGGQGGDGQKRVTADRAPPQQPAEDDEPEAPTISPEAARRADEFRNAHSWFNNPRSERDKDDSEVIKFLDDLVTKKGFKPETQDYWDELEDMAGEYLPHRFSNGNTSNVAGNRASPPQRNVTQQPQRRAPPVATSEGGSQKPTNKVKITPERKDALIQLGIIDASGKVLDQAQLDRKVRSFAEFDREHAQGR